MTWARSSDQVAQLLAQGELEVATAPAALARRLIDEGRRHPSSAESVADDDPTGAYQLAYGAARKTCSSLLGVQELRAGGPATSRPSTPSPGCSAGGQPANTPAQIPPRSPATTPTTRQHRPPPTCSPPPNRSSAPIASTLPSHLTPSFCHSHSSGQTVATAFARGWQSGHVEGADGALAVAEEGVAVSRAESWAPVATTRGYCMTITT